MRRIVGFASSSTTRDPIEIAPGEKVSVGHEDDEFPGWKWCKARDGCEGWVPVELLSNEGTEAIVLYDYSARELAERKLWSKMLATIGYWFVMGLENGAGSPSTIQYRTTRESALRDYVKRHIFP